MFKEASLSAHRIVYLGLGCNLGDRRKSLEGAIDALGRAGAPARIRSSLYRTDPVDVLDQEEFLNQVVTCEVTCPAESLLEACLQIERGMGRERGRKGGPRIIDIDLLLDGERVVEGERLVLPHPRLHLRRFVLVPLVEIAAEVVHPVLRRTARELLRDCPDRSGVERLGR